MKSIRISGINYEIKFLDPEQMGGNIGLADFNKQQILINNSFTEQTQRIAVLHETLHILDKSYNIKMTEEQVTYLTHALVALVADNPDSDVL